MTRTICTALVLTVSTALVAGCNRPDSSSAGSSASPDRSSSSSTGSSGQTPRGGATGQASEGSTDTGSAPKRPASR
jgi:hypothetical protein